MRAVRRTFVTATALVALGVALTAAADPALAAPAAPTGLAVSASSEFHATSVVVTGIADPGSTVTLYTTVYDLQNPCGDAPVATGTAAQFATTGIVVPVYERVTTTIAATATDAGLVVSPCSSTVSYTNVPYPPPPPPPSLDTTLTRTPPAKVKTSKATAKVAFQFSSNVSDAKFECSMDKVAFAPCVSGQKFAVKVGRHSFTVRSTLGGDAVDLTPSTYSFKVKKKRPKVTGS
jgi:hypothetical protein